MNLSGQPAESSNSHLSPLAPPFEPRDQSTRTIQTQIESMQQPNQEGLNNDLEDSSYLTCPLDLSLVPKVKKPQNHCQQKIQPGATVSHQHTMDPQSNQNISQNFGASESSQLQGPIIQGYPVLFPLRQATMSNGHFICHPSGMRLLNNQTGYSQFNNRIPQNIFVPDGFNPHGGADGLVLHPVDQALQTNSRNLDQNQFHSQSQVVLSSNKTIYSRVDYECAPNTLAYVGMNPRVTTQASGPLALPFGVLPNNELTKWPVTPSNPPRWVSEANLYSSNYKSPPSVLSLENQLADVQLQLDSSQGTLDKKYKDESDYPLCDLHFQNLFWRLPQRLIKGRGTPCFVCQKNAEVGIVIPGAGEMRGARDELEGACARPMMNTTAARARPMMNTTAHQNNTHELEGACARPMMNTTAQQYKTYELFGACAHPMININELFGACARPRMNTTAHQHTTHELEGACARPMMNTTAARARPMMNTTTHQHTTHELEEACARPMMNTTAARARPMMNTTTHQHTTHELEEACARPMMCTIDQYNTQFPSLLPSSEHYRKKGKQKELTESEQADKKNKAGTCSTRDGPPQSQTGRNYQERPGASMGRKFWKNQLKSKHEQN